MNKKLSAQQIDMSIMIALGIFALILALGMTYYVTEGLPHLEDEITYLFQARTFARGELIAPPAPVFSAFFTPFVITMGDGRIGKYSIGWPLLLAIGERFSVGWLVNPIFGALTVMIIFLLGRDLYNRPIGLIAGMLAATSPFFLIQSSTYMSHTSAGFFVGVLMWAFLKGERSEELRNKQRWMVVAGISLGMLALTRTLTAVAVGLPFGLTIIIRVIRRPADIKKLIADYWPLVVISGLIAALQPLYLYLVTGNGRTNLYTIIWEYDRIGFGEDFGRYGHSVGEGIYITQKAIILWSSELFGWKYTSWLPLMPGIIYGVQKGKQGEKWWSLLLFAPFVMLVVAYLAYWIGANIYGPRYHYEGLVGLAILAAAGLWWLSERVWRLFKDARLGHLLGLDGLSYLLTFCLICINLTTYLPGRIGDWYGLYGISRQPLRELEEIRETDQVLVFVRGGYWRNYGEFFYLNSPWYDDDIIAAHDNTPIHVETVLEVYPDREVWFYYEGVYSKEPAPYPTDEDN